MYAIRSYYAVHDGIDLKLAHQKVGDMTKDSAEKNLISNAILYAAKNLGVITSYSIHYTKLYEGPGTFYPQILPGEGTWGRRAYRAERNRCHGGSDTRGGRGYHRRSRRRDAGPAQGQALAAWRTRAQEERRQER